MTAEDLNVPSELVKILMDIGYVATGRGFQSQAADIFSGVIAARPNSELPLIGLAVSKINFGNFLEASKILSERALIINPNSGLAKCFLSMAIRALGGKSEADELLNEVVQSEASDECSKKLATDLINQENSKSSSASLPGL